MATRIPRVLLRRFKIAGIHFETYGSANQPWDQKVGLAVVRAFKNFALPAGIGHFEVESTWYVSQPKGKRRDVDNLRIKPALDAITATGRVWKDDCFPILRKVNRRALAVPTAADEHVVIRLYGIP